MTDSISKEIDRGWELLFNEGKLEAALNLVLGIEKKNLTREMNLRCQILKGIIKYQLGRPEEVEEVQKITNYAIQESKKLRNLKILTETLFLELAIVHTYDRTLNLDSDVTYLEKFIKESPHESTVELDHAEAIVKFIKSWFYWGAGVLDPALELLKDSHDIIKRYKEQTFLESNIYLLLGHLYENKGELDLALSSLKKSLEYIKLNTILSNGLKGSAFNKLANVYYQMSNLDLAVDYSKKSIEFLEPIEIPIYSIETSWAYDTLIKLFLDKNSLELAKEYLEYFDQYNKKHGIYGDMIQWYELSEARILKSSNRTRDRAKAEEILKKIKNIPDASIQLSELYLEELRTTNNLEILDDIQPLITRLLKESERMNSYSLQAQTILLNGKLSLLRFNIGDARGYLTQAQRIAEEHSLQLLAREISNEHDRLLEYMDKLKNAKESEISISERMNLTALDETVVYMQGRRALDPPEIVKEDSILLLIMDHDGVSYFNHSFIDEWDYHDLFSSFMSAFNTFSSEIFSDSIDRIKIGENLILIKPIEQFLVCYVIKGQSYPALQKLNRFSDAIKWKPDIWKALNKAVHTSEVLELNNPVSLGEIMNEIFN
jgi:tetratricopeptide (TPR) repeat protein